MVPGAQKTGAGEPGPKHALGGDAAGSRVLVHLPTSGRQTCQSKGKHPWKTHLPTALANPTAPRRGLVLRQAGVHYMDYVSFSSQTPSMETTEPCTLTSRLPGVTSPISCPFLTWFPDGTVGVAEGGAGDTWEAELRQGEQVHAIGDTNVFRREALPGLCFGLVPLLPEGAPSGLAQSRRGDAGRLTVLLSDERRHKHGQDLWIERRGAADPLLEGHLKRGQIRVSHQERLSPPAAQDGEEHGSCFQEPVGSRAQASHPTAQRLALWLSPGTRPDSSKSGRQADPSSNPALVAPQQRTLHP